jgi:hypothetical protein
MIVERRRFTVRIDSLGRVTTVEILVPAQKIDAHRVTCSGYAIGVEEIVAGYGTQLTTVERAKTTAALRDRVLGPVSYGDRTR